MKKAIDFDGLKCYDFKHQKSFLRKETQTMKNAVMNMAKYFRFTVRFFAGYFCYAYYYFYRKNKICASEMAV